MIEQHKRGELLIIKRRGHGVPTTAGLMASTHKGGGGAILLQPYNVVIFLRRSGLDVQILTSHGVVWIFGSHVCRLPTE
jgi:hypothetical protein